MTVYFDLLGSQNRDNSSRGIARYVATIANAIEAADPNVIDHYVLHPHLPVPESLASLMSAGKVIALDKVRPPQHPGVYIAGSVFELGESIDRVVPRWARRPRWRTVGFVQDMIPALFPEQYLPTEHDRSQYDTRMRSLQQFDHLLVISQATADDVGTILGIPAAKMTVVGAGAADHFQRSSRHHRVVAADLVGSNAVPGLRESFILVPSGMDFRKNIERTMEAYAKLPSGLRRRYQLAMVCATTPNELTYLHGLREKFKLGRDFLATGFVPDSTLVDLYQGAELVVFPSLYEGFGLPVLEAMRCGAPVLCSDSSSLKEVQPDPDARFDPTTTASITKAIADSLLDDDFRRGLRGQALSHFSWEIAAQATIDVIDDLRSAQSTYPPAPSPTVAVVSPLPPQMSGIAAYAQRMCRQLGRFCDVTVFTDEPVTAHHVDGAIEVRGVADLAIMHEAGDVFDEIIYFIGNSQFHIGALEALRQVPGVVLLHDARLSELYNAIADTKPRMLVGGTVGQTLHHLYPHRYAEDLGQADRIDQSVAGPRGVFLAKEVADLATRVLVHSTYAAHQVELDTATVPTVAFEMPAPCYHRRWALDATPATPTVTSYGLVGSPKDPDLLIEACAIASATLPMLDLRFVGWVHPRYRRALEEHASGLEFGRLHFDDYLSESDYEGALRNTTIAVQLRKVTNGESSAALMDLMATGTPTIANNLGSVAELDGDLIVRVSAYPTADELSDAIVALIGDTEQLSTLSKTSWERAQVRSFETAARSLADFLFN